MFMQVNIVECMQKISLASVLKACNFIKKRLQHGCFPVSIPKVLGTIFFYRTATVAALELCFNIRKNFLKRKLMERLPLI